MPDSSPLTNRSIDLLSRDDCRLLIVDMQQKLLPHIPVAEAVIANCRRLMQAAEILKVPVTGTEQYPKGLGPTTQELASRLAEWPEKLRFSCTQVLDWGTAAEQPDGRFQVVVAGIEAHVCVLQTALDLIADGFRVFVPADAVASRRKLDWSVALQRLSASGATVTTTESVLFEWCEVAGTPEFKQMSQLVKNTGNTNT